MFKHADVAVVTVIPTEGGAVLQRLKRFPSYRSSQEGRFYHGATVAGQGTTLHRLVMTSSIDQGQPQIAPVCRDMIERFDPLLIVLLGVGGSIHTDARLYDVCIADRIISYTKVKEKDQETVTRGDMYRMNAWLRVLVNEYFVICGGQPTTLRSENRSFRVHWGPMGTGNAVIGTQVSRTREWLRSTNDKTLVVETEAEGISEVTAQLDVAPRAKRLSGSMVVRGVSDHADLQKADDPQPIAAKHAFEALLSFLGHTGRLSSGDDQMQIKF